MSLKVVKVKKFKVIDFIKDIIDQKDDEDNNELIIKRFINIRRVSFDKKIRGDDIGFKSINKSNADENIKKKDDKNDKLLKAC